MNSGRKIGFCQIETGPLKFGPDVIGNYSWVGPDISFNGSGSRQLSGLLPFAWEMTV